MSMWCPSMGANLLLAAKRCWGVHFTGRAAGIVFFRIRGFVDAGYLPRHIAITKAFKYTPFPARPVETDKTSLVV